MGKDLFFMLKTTQNYHRRKGQSKTTELVEENIEANFIGPGLGKDFSDMLMKVFSINNTYFNWI